MKILLLLAVVYGIYKISNMNKLTAGQNNNKLDQEEDDGFTDFEEVE